MKIIHQYLNKRTLITGDVKSGKTARTLKILAGFIQAGYADRIAVIDMAPDPVQGIGGKMTPPADAPLLYLTTTIAAPRLTGADKAHTLRLAVQNARAIEALFDLFQQQPKDILFVNDASLYLQAGDLNTFLMTLKAASTQIINVYYGGTFVDSTLTRREKHLTDELMKTCDKTIHLD
ncbi:MAG: hypothetical protein P1P89_19255 [Desulfobacterales bacterium]|nr:hypothetical protein [Desulfobacterales bacterium]